MNTGKEKFAQTQPFSDDDDTNSINQEVDEGMNDVDRLGKQSGLEMDDREELGLEAKLEKRDNNRLNFDLSTDV
jgi:hypothetical protein